MDSKSLNNFQSVSPKDQSCEIWLKLAQWFWMLFKEIVEGWVDGWMDIHTYGYYSINFSAQSTQQDTKYPTSASNLLGIFWTLTE